MNSSGVDNKRRIARNTMYLYLRMMFTMAIGLITSRVVLKVLGVDDYGVYNVVGGIVAMFSFINASMSGATSRYLTYGLGAKNIDGLGKTFSASLEIHIAIALVILFLSETIGLWFMNNKLDIPKDSLYAANWVYQCSILVAIISITQVPYNAAIIAHENMDIFAVIEIINSVLKLFIVYILFTISGDKLIIYGLLVLGVSIIVAFIYRKYCLSHYTECKFVFVREKSLVKTMLSFCGWDLYGNLSSVMRTQGVNMLVNVFFGVVANTAYGIAMQVQSAVGSFSSNIATAVRPQIIKSYASGEYDEMRKLVYTSSKYIFMLLAIVSIPLILEMEFVLKIWLGEVPEYSVWLCRLTVLFLFFSILSLIMVTGVHATGKIKLPSIINGSIYMSVIPISYIAFKYGLSIYIPFVCNALFVFFGCCVNLYTVKKYVPQINFKSYFSEVIFKCVCATILSTIVPAIIYFTYSNGWIRLISIILSSIIFVSIATYAIVSNRKEKKLILNKLISTFRKNA